MYKSLPLLAAWRSVGPNFFGHIFFFSYPVPSSSSEEAFVTNTESLTTEVTRSTSSSSPPPLPPPHPPPPVAILPHTSLFLFSPSNVFRRCCHRIVNGRFFDVLVIVVICASSIALAAEDPVDEDSLRNEILQYFDYIFTAVFAVEMLLKVWLSIVYLLWHNFLSIRLSLSLTHSF